MGDPQRMQAPGAEHVQARDGDVQSLHERGVTWVSFKPIPDMALRDRLHTPKVW